MTSRWQTLWETHRAYLLEAFLAFNLSFLAIDILIAHAVNRFARPEEWIPFGFSLLCALVLMPLSILSWRRSNLRFARPVVVLFGALSMIVGLAGLAFHLESQFLREQTLKHLVYTAPFAAPLAYAGLGSLIIVNRFHARNEGWASAVLFAALGGFFGNFVLALCDHAQNGFFHPIEWLAVASPALATGFLTIAILMPNAPRAYFVATAGILLVQCAVGTAGFAFHTLANLRGPAEDPLRNFIHGAPAFAPLLFVNISMLAAFGLVDRLRVNRS